MVWEFVNAQGSAGATADEVGEHFGWQHQTYSSAVSTLKRDGLLVWSGRTRPTLSGNEAQVMVTPEHYRMLRPRRSR